MDELTAVQQLLAEPPPGPEVTEAAWLKVERAALDGTPGLRRDAGPGRQAIDPVRRSAGPRRWPGWLTPVAAAATVVAVVFASLGISSAIRHGLGGTSPAGATGALAKVPQYFVALPIYGTGQGVVGDTATGAVLGTIKPPKHYAGFWWAAAAANDRTFVLVAGIPPHPNQDIADWHSGRFFRLVLSPSGRPGPLTPLPVPPESSNITGVALSPDGSKLAVSLASRAHQSTGSRLQVFSLATGAERQWEWPGQGAIGDISASGAGNSTPNAWDANNRTLMFQVTTQTGQADSPAQLRLLDTAAPGGSLRAASTPIPLPARYLGRQQNRSKYVVGIPLITGDGHTLVTSFFHNYPRPRRFGFTITDFSVRTGMPTRVVYQLRTAYETGAPGLWWVNNSGSAMIANRGAVTGVQTPTSFTPLPPRTQHLFAHNNGSMTRWPVW